MSAFLYRLGRTSARHPFRVLGLWLVAAVAVMALQGSAGGEFDNSERVPGVESQHAADVLNDRFPSQGGLSARIVLHTDDGRLDDADHAPTVEQARAQLAAGAAVAGVTDPFAPEAAAVSADGQTAYLDVTYALDKLTATQLDDALAVTDAGRADGVQVELTGSLALLAQEDPSSELIGVGVADHRAAGRLRLGGRDGAPDRHRAASASSSAPPASACCRPSWTSRSSP